jgi:hypothetical protein
MARRLSAITVQVTYVKVQPDESLGYAYRQVEAACLAAASVRTSYTRAERGCKDCLPIQRRDGRFDPLGLLPRAPRI